MLENKEYLTGAEAAKFLGVKPASLYAYVSRGLLSSVAPDGGRTRFYKISDLKNLRNNQRGMSSRDEVRDWAGPSIKSAITEITPQGHFYRGRSALQLAEQNQDFARVVAILWDVDLDLLDSQYAYEKLDLSRSSLRALRMFSKVLRDDASVLEGLKLFVPILEMCEPAPVSLNSADVLQHGVDLIYAMTCALAYIFKTKSSEKFKVQANSISLAQGLSLALGRKSKKAELEYINKALVLCADHELNASAFSARLAASTGATLHASVLAALATFSGTLHGGASTRFENIVLTAMQFDSTTKWLREISRSGSLSEIKRSGSELYPDGDPRARLLLEQALELAPESRDLAALMALLEYLKKNRQIEPTLDAGLAAMRFALRLPPGAGAAVFAIARTAGWIAHAREQQLFGVQIRPRAKYIGS